MKRTTACALLATLHSAVGAMPGRATSRPSSAEAVAAGRIRGREARQAFELATAGLTSGAWREIQDRLEASSYHAGPAREVGEAPAFAADNRRQRYETTFRRKGIEIASQADWRLGLSLSGVGYGGDVRPLPAAEPRAENERVEYRRGPVTEWYVNRPGGLEQGFDIAEPPTKGSGPLVVALSVEGDLGLALEGGEAVFADGSGRTVMRYQGLRAWDAEGRALPSRMEAQGRELRLLVQAETARFPVTVDPTFRREAQLLASDGAPIDLLGISAAISGDTALVGASGAGSAYAFVRSGTTWTQQQELLASDGVADDYFGHSVAISGDTAVVGAYYDDTDGGTDAGSAYVFVRSGTTWTQQQKLTAADAAPGDHFGEAVAVSGNTVLVGANFGDTAAGANAGAAYVFVRSGSTWTQDWKLVASDGAVGDTLGRAVALSGNTAIVGASGSDTAGLEAGAAYVFVRSGVFFPIWTQQQKLTAADGAAFQYLGSAVALSGDTAVVGAYLGSVAGAQSGSAYVFVRSGSAWAQEWKLTAADAASTDYFGYSVALSGDTAIVGAFNDDTSSGVDAGSAYAFVRSGGTWTQQQQLRASSGSPDDRFGYSVALSGDTAIVGAFRDDTTGGADAGSAQAYRLFAKGDLNLDGGTDLLVRHDATGQNDAWLMNGVTRLGGPVAVSPTPPSSDWIVAGTDDFNADRWNDLLLWNGATGAAEFWLMNGTARIGAPLPLAGALPPPWKPSAVADFNRDGQPDVVYHNFTTQKIQVWTLNVTTHAGTLVPTPDQAADFNWEIVGAQDWNADGNPDFLWYNPNSGKVVLWFMDANLVRLTGRFTNPPSAGNNNWQVRAMGDYGIGTGGLPGTIDIVWRNATSGKFVVWHMDQAGNRTSGLFSSPDSPSPNPTDWTIVGPR